MSRESKRKKFSVLFPSHKARLSKYKLANTEVVNEANCGCTFGKCLRNEKKKGTEDWFEPLY